MRVSVTLCFLLPESRCRHHVAHTNVDILIVPLISRDVLSPPQRGWKVFTERDSLDFCRYYTAHVLKYLFICGLGNRKQLQIIYNSCCFKLRAVRKASTEEGDLILCDRSSNTRFSNV